MLRDALTTLLDAPRRPLRLAATGALLLAVPDLARQLPVRDDPSLLHALVVDAVGFLSGAALQLALVGLVAGARLASSFPEGVRLLLVGLRRRPGAVVGGLVVSGLVSGLVTLPVSWAVLSPAQVLGPLEDPALWRLVVAQASDVVATVLTAAYWSVLVVMASGRQPVLR